LESSDIEGMWNGLGEDMDEIITQEQLMDMGVATLAGAGGIMLSGTLLPRIPWVKDVAWRKSAAAILLGLVSGRLLWNVNREAALGLAGGMSGVGLASLVSQWTGVNVSLSDLGETTVITSQAEELLGALSMGGGRRQTFEPSTDILALGEGGLSASPTVQEQDLAPLDLNSMFDETTVIESERERLLGTWIGG
jgi:hypothetical protein